VCRAGATAGFGSRALLGGKPEPQRGGSSSSTRFRSFSTMFSLDRSGKFGARMAGFGVHMVESEARLTKDRILQSPGTLRELSFHRNDPPSPQLKLFRVQSTDLKGGHHALLPTKAMLCSGIILKRLKRNDPGGLTRAPDCGCPGQKRMYRRG